MLSVVNKMNFVKSQTTRFSSWLQAFTITRDDSTDDSSGICVLCIIKRVRWEKTPHGWVKLNTDGAAAGNTGLAGCGGLLRDEHGNWLAGFARRIGTTTSFVAELWGLRDGLSLCYNLNIYLPSLLSLMQKQLLIFFRNQTMRIT